MTAAEKLLTKASTATASKSGAAVVPAQGRLGSARCREFGRRAADLAKNSSPARACPSAPAVSRAAARAGTPPRAQAFLPLPVWVVKADLAPVE